MPNRYEILSAIESLFLSIQNKINSLRNGSVIRSIFYSVSTAVEEIYDSIEEVKNNSYIHTAQGEYLDQLIYGLSKLERIKGTRALGYVTLSPVNFSISDNLSAKSLSKLIFSKLNLETNSLYIPPLASTIKVSTTNGIFEYAILPPIRLMQFLDDSFFEINPQTGNQKVAEILTNYAISLLQQKPNHNIKYIILPLISIETGADKNLITGTINTFINADKFKFLVENNFDYVLVNNISLKETVLDIDSVAKLESDSIILGMHSEINGGTDEEDDENYRQRYWNFLGSLTKGTLNAIKNKLYTLIPNSDIQIYQSNYPGIIDVYISSSNMISTSLPILISQLEDVQPVGTIINLRTAKTNLFNVLLEVKENISTSDVDKIRKRVSDNINSLGIGEELNFSKLWQSVVNDYNIQSLYFGFSLTPELFETYKDTFKKFICSVYYDKDNPSQLPNKCQSNDYFTYAEYLDFVKQGRLAIYIYSRPNDFISYRTRFSLNSNTINIQAPKYPERKLIESVLNGAYGTIINSSIAEYQDLINEIQNSCRNKPIDLCFRELSYSLYNKLLTHPLNSIGRIGINIEMIESIDPISANYLKIKLLTIPIPSDNDIELCESLLNDTDFCSNNAYEIKLLYSLLNDVQYIQYKDIDSFQKDKEVCKIASSNIINNEYAYKYNVGVRKA